MGAVAEKPAKQAEQPGDEASAGLRKTSSSSGMRRGSFIKRLSSTGSTDRPYERRSSTISKVPSGKSISESVRTRLASVSKAEYHADLKDTIQSGLTLNLVCGSFVILFGSSFLFGYNIGCLNAIKDHITVFYNETYTERAGTEQSDWTIVILWSLTNAIYIPGGMAGAFLAGFMADRLGRKKSILFSHIFAFIASILAAVCQVAKAPELLMLSRIIQGFNCGIGGTIAPMFLSEISPFNLRGALGTAHQLFITIGIFVSSIFALPSLLGHKERWPYVIFLNAVPAFVSLVIMPFLPDSPRYLLLAKGEREEAEKALQWYRNTEEVAGDMEEMDTEHQQAASAEAEERMSLKTLFTSKDLRQPLLVACFLQVIQQFSGINAIFFFSKSIFENANVKPEHITYAILGTNAVNVLMTIISVPLMDKAGRRPLLLYPMVVMILDLVLITVSLNLQAINIAGMEYVSIAAVIIYVIGFAVGLGPIPWLIGAELFRQGPRPKAMAVAGVVNWVCNFVIAMGFEPLQKGLTNFTFLVFLVLMMGFIVFVFFKVPETKNKTFEEISHAFSPGGHVDVEEMVDDDDQVFDDIPPATDNAEDTRLVTMDLSSKADKEPSSPEGIEMKDVANHDEEKVPLKKGQ